MGQNHSMPRSTYTSAKQPVGCQCHPQSTDTCCELMCFERPNYFCGHMLTDRDLMSEQRYLREKNKLYHRALDGHGIVCGLRITCNHDCPGEIRIEEGYAIDNCGNDLVVCKTARFDVIQRLKEKGLLVEEPKQDPCEPKQQKPTCEVTQCFHVTICYKETEADFTTPFVAGCSPTLTECEPTRIREEVWFEVVEELPEELDWIDNLERRIRACFELLTHSQFGKKLQDKKESLLRIASNTPRTDFDCGQLFCELRSLFLLHLRKHPDKYNCDLEQEILHIPFPEDDPNKPNSCHDAICELLRLAWQYTMTCVLGEFVPQCDEPSSGSCLVLGTVEVRNGKVVQVCNCPRTYIQRIDRMVELFFTSLFGQLACEHQPASPDAQAGKGLEKPDPCKNKPRAAICCADLSFDCRCFVDLVLKDPNHLVDNVLAFLRQFRQYKSNFENIFDFTRACAATESFVTNQAMVASAMRGDGGVLRIREFEVQIDEKLEPGIVQALETPLHRLLDRNQPVYALKLGQKIVSAFQPQGMEAVMQAQINSLRAELAELRAQTQISGGEAPTKASRKRSPDTQP
ncbi:MAG: hypothetical protein AB7F94_05035 [Nitrospira sp.]